METRKIQRVSSGTLTVSLPKGWAEAQDIGFGTVVNLHTHLDGVLVIQAREREDDGTRRATVPIDHDDPARLERTLRAAYAAGFEAVTLTAAEGFTADQRRAVGRVANSLAGVTVADEAEDWVTVRTLLDSTDVSVRQSVRQLRFVALSMHRDATAALVGDAPVEGFDDRDDWADRLFAMVDRHLGRSLVRLDEVDALGLARPELFELRTTARELERVADHAERIGALAADLDEAAVVPVADEFPVLAETARSAVEDGVSVVLGDADCARAHRALAARDEVRAGVDALDRRLFEAAASDYRLTHALDSLRRTAEHGATIAELGIRTAIRRGESAALDAGGGTGVGMPGADG
jgi:phosphate uptake regulator